jgi:hypothetical protein
MYPETVWQLKVQNILSSSAAATNNGLQNL